MSRHAIGTGMREFQLAALNTDEILQGGPDAVEDLQAYIDECGDDGELEGKTLKDVLRERALRSVPTPPPDKKRWQKSPTPCRITWEVEDDASDEEILPQTTTTTRGAPAAQSQHSETRPGSLKVGDSQSAGSRSGPKEHRSTKASQEDVKQVPQHKEKEAAPPPVSFEEDDDDDVEMIASEGTEEDRQQEDDNEEEEEEDMEEKEQEEQAEQEEQQEQDDDEEQEEEEDHDERASLSQSADKHGSRASKAKGSPLPKKMRPAKHIVRVKAEDAYGEGSGAEESVGLSGRLHRTPANKVAKLIATRDHGPQDDVDDIQPAHPSELHGPGDSNHSSEGTVAAKQKTGRLKRLRKVLETKEELEEECPAQGEELPAGADLVDGPEERQGPAKKRKRRAAAKDLGPEPAEPARYMVASPAVRKRRKAAPSINAPQAASSSIQHTSSNQQDAHQRQDEFKRALALDLLKVIALREERMSAMFQTLVALVRDLLKPDGAEGHSHECVAAMEKLRQELS